MTLRPLKTWSESLQIRAVGGGWSSLAARRIRRECGTPRDLFATLGDGDPNVRIVAAQLLGDLAATMSHEFTRSAIDALLPLLKDKASNDYVYGGGFSCDDEAPLLVSDVAVDSLRRLDPGWRPQQPR